MVVATGSSAWVNIPVKQQGTVAWQSFMLPCQLMYFVAQ